MAGVQWSAGGWFGAQIGSTVWMLLLGGLLVPHDPTAAAVVLGGFAATNLVGLWLWSRRDRLGAYPAVQTLVAVAGGCAAVATVVVNQRDAMVPLASITGGLRWIPYPILLVYPGLMVQFHLDERRARRGDRES